MPKYTTEQIRNIALAGHAASGKTTLVEALLHHAGAISTPGDVRKGNTVCDFEQEEKQNSHSLTSALAHLDYKDTHINLIDTPGYPDFMGHTLSVLPAADALAIVINAQTGVESTSRRLMQWAAKQKFCRMIIVNKIDDAGPNLSSIVNEIQAEFGKECLPVNLPAKQGGVIDCFFGTDGEAEFSSVKESHTALIDQVVEVDEDLMALYLEQGEIAPEQLHDPFEKALREGHLVPVFFVSAQEATGIQELLDFFVRLMPNPIEGTSHFFLDETAAGDKTICAEPNPEGHGLAHVFKIRHDPFVGKLAIFRVHSGTFTKDSQLYMDDRNKTFKVGHLFKLQGKELIEVDTCVPGDICAVAKINELHLDAMLHDSPDEAHVHFKPMGFPQPMAGLAIQPKSHGNEQKIADALEKLTAEDPCLVLEHNAATHETVLRGLGELHLRIALQRLKERHNVEVETHPPTIAYRETITRPAEGHFRHKKQSGGAGQFGEVFLKIEPNERGSGIEFVDKVVGGSIPGQFIPGIEKGVRQAAQLGALAGYHIHDVRVTVYDGKHHAVDSNEISFVTAGRKAFLAAFHNAGAIVLEPIVNIHITVPDKNIGDITGDLSARRGRISDTKARSGGILDVAGQVPLAELTDYQTRLKSLTGGEGSFTIELSSYEPVPPNLQQQLTKAFKSETAN